jgi:hypothetical protein
MKSQHSISTNHRTADCTEVRFASFLSGGFTIMAVINPLVKCTLNLNGLSLRILKEENWYLTDERIIWW